MTRSQKTLLKKFNITKEAKIIIRKEHRTEFMCGVTAPTAPARRHFRRGSVATERYVAAEIVSNDNVSMEIEEDLAIRGNIIEYGNQIPEFPTQEYSARQLQNLSRFHEIPRISRSYTQFFNYHDHSGRVPQAANSRAPFNDEYLQNLARMFEIAPLPAHANAARAQNFFDPIARRNQMPQAARFNEASIRDLAVFEPIVGRSPFQRMPQAAIFGDSSMQASNEFTPTRAQSFAVGRPPLPELTPIVPRQPQAEMRDQENRPDVPNLLTDAHGFLDYIKNAANQFHNKKK